MGLVPTATTTTIEGKMTIGKIRNVIDDFFKKTTGAIELTTTSKNVFDYAFAEGVRRMNILNARSQSWKRYPSRFNYKPQFKISLNDKENKMEIFNHQKRLIISRISSRSKS